MRDMSMIKFYRGSALQKCGALPRYLIFAFKQLNADRREWPYEGAGTPIIKFIELL